MRSLVLATLLAFCAACGFLWATAEADPGDPPHPEWAEMWDAGAPPPATTTFPSTTPPLPDPTEDPAGFFAAAQRAYQSGAWALLVVLLLFALTRGAIYAAARWPGHLGWLDGWRLRAAVAAAGVLTAIGAALMSGGAVVSAAMGALGAAVALFLKPEAPPKKKPKPTTISGRRPPPLRAA